MAEENSEQGADQETNESKKTFKDLKNKFFSFLDSGVEASKKGIKSAGSAISDFGDKSVVRIELTQLNSKLEKSYKSFGELCYKKLSESETLSNADEDVKKELGVVKEILDGISERKKQLSEGEKEQK